MRKLLKRAARAVLREVEHVRALQEMREMAKRVTADPTATETADKRVTEAESNRDVWRNYALTLELYLTSTDAGWREKYTAFVREQGAAMHQH